MKSDLDSLDLPGIELHRKFLLSTRNASKCSRHLELGIISVKYVIIEKRLQFLNNTLYESI